MKKTVPVIQAPPPLRHEEVDQCADIIAAVDRKAKEIERKWGIGRLPFLVPIALMERFRSQQHKFNLATMALDAAECRKHGGAMERAYTKLEDAAHEAGHYPRHADVWEFTLRDGGVVMLVRDRAEMAQVDPKGRAVQIWSLDEVADVIAKFPVLSLAKEHFPGAVVESIRPSREAQEALDDSLMQIPFA